MEKIKFRVMGNQIEVVERPAVITAGMVGLEAEFAFDSRWDALTKTAVFKAGDKVIATLLENSTHTIPWEVLEKPKQWLCVGVYGANAEGTVVIPTLWAEVAVIHTGVDPTGDPATEPTMPIWQEALTLAEQGALAEQELRAGVDGLAQELNLEHESPNLGDVFSELLALERKTEIALHDHTQNGENPHNVTCEQLGAVTIQQMLDLNVQVQEVSDIAHNNAVDIAIHTNTEENPNPHEITCEKIGAAGVLTVTVNGTTPSHTNAQIYAAITEGKLVYLKVFESTYTICVSATPTEAKFESSYVITIGGSDGKNYSAQQFRVFAIQNNVYKMNNLTIPSQAYIDAQIAYYLSE